jgi:hypothetical protein
MPDCPAGFKLIVHCVCSTSCVVFFLGVMCVVWDAVSKCWSLTRGSEQPMYLPNTNPSQTHFTAPHYTHPVSICLPPV